MYTKINGCKQNYTHVLVTMNSIVVVFFHVIIFIPIKMQL